MGCWLGRLTASLKRRRVMEWMVTSILFMAVLNLLLVLLTGGHGVAFGPLRLSATLTPLSGPLLITLGASIMACWLRAKNHGIPVSQRLKSPILLFLSVALVYSLNG